MSDRPTRARRAAALVLVVGLCLARGTSTTADPKDGWKERRKHTHERRREGFKKAQEDYREWQKHRAELERERAKDLKERRKRRAELERKRRAESWQRSSRNRRYSGNPSKDEPQVWIREARRK